MEKYVIYYDLSSSTKVFEDLWEKDKIKKYKDFMEKFLRDLFNHKNLKNIKFHKFMGDGGILFMDAEEKTEKLINFMIIFGTHIIVEYERMLIENKFDISNSGIRFGVDVGAIHKLDTPNNKNEYFGRPLNIGARLVSRAEKNEVYISKSVYEKISDKNCKTYFARKVIKLKSISDKFIAYKMNLEKRFIKEAINKAIKNSNTGEIIELYNNRIIDNC